MMGIWNEASYGPEQRKRLDLQMCGGGNDVGFVQRDVGVIFLVDIEILDKALPKKIVKRNGAFLQKLF
jgi:hypothetical protein